MQNIDMLFEMNKGTGNRNIRLHRNILEVKITAKDNLFTGKQIRQIINIINDAHKKYGKLKYSIYFYLGNVKFIDKLTYVLFECICYYLIEQYGHPVQVFMNVNKNIGTDGIYSSPLKLLNGTKIGSVRQYPEVFHFDIYGYHFRRVINGNGKEETNYLGDLYEQIDRFLKVFSMDEECRNEVGHVITELVGNVNEHTQAECLIDIDVAPYYKRYKNKAKGELEDNNYYYGINIAIVNFSNKLLGEDILKNIVKTETKEYNDRYKSVVKAYEYHKSQFSSQYTEEDFGNITTFQTKISGRKDKFGTGGTGLTVLIHSLEKKSTKHRCYVISGKRSVNFFADMLEYNQNGWIGFNTKKDYLHNIPDEKVVTECLIYMPGTAYNLNFVMKGEMVNDSENFIEL